MVKKFVELTDITDSPDLRKKIMGHHRCKEFARICLIDIEECKKDVDQAYKKELNREFKGIKSGFFYSDCLEKHNMITDKALISTLMKLKKHFNEYGELLIYINY